MADNYKIMLFFASTLKEFSTTESNGEPFIYLQDSDYGIVREITLPIFAKDGKWVAESNKVVGFFKEEKAVAACPLGPGTLIAAKIKGFSRSVYILSLKLDDSYMQFKRFILPQGKEVSIGSAKENDIAYANTGVSKLHAKISLNANGGAVLNCIKAGRIYLNGLAMHSDFVTVKFGDEINIMGLKIILFSGFVLINNPENKMICKLQSGNDMQIDEKVVADELESGYYTKTPRLIKYLEKGVFEVDLPPPPSQQKPQPLLLMIGPSMTMGFAMLASLGFSIYSAKAGGNMSTAAMSGIMAVSMLVGAVVWPIATRKYQKKMTEKEENNRVEQYCNYMVDVDLELTKKAEWNREIMHEIHPEPRKIVGRFVNGSRKLWERTAQDEDFIAVRVGLGEQRNDLNVSIPKARFTLVDDPLKDEPGKLRDKFNRIQDMPIVVPLREDVVVGIIGTRKERLGMTKCMAIQLAGLHSYDELKMVFICNETQKKEFAWVKQLPHIWSDDKSIRFFAANKTESHEVFNYLEEVIREREETKRDGLRKKTEVPYFVVFVLDRALVEDEPAMRYLADSKNGMSIYSVFIGESMGILPSDCQTIIQYDDKACSIFTKSRKEEGQLHFKADDVTDEDIGKFSNAVGMYSLNILGGNQSIPSALDFLGMFKVGCIEQLGIAARWNVNMPHKSLAAPIGVKAGGELFSLNIHEKYHGPHGLVAGMTGSGKSEFIQSYILSMAINYHPHNVSFILIDYKGGGMANCFKGLPHVAGVITNLGGNQIRRSLISINAELKRRQRIFGMADVSNIDDYHTEHIQYMEDTKNGKMSKSKASIPLPHLVIISDEFAELKSQQPEFMEKLVSAARIGRSLGVHLILATQRPAGVVDDQIWSNSRFRVCLKVLDRNDSQEMLKRPEAAKITLPGRGYVQVGYNEIFECIQSGYSGAAYIPEDEYIDADEQKVVMIDECARQSKAASTKKVQQDVKKVKQLDSIVKYIKEYSESSGILPVKLWPEPLDELICLNKVKGFKERSFNGSKWSEQPEWLAPVIGIVDDPEKQEQYPLKLEIGSKGHVILYGMPSTGKTTFLQTLLYSTACMYSPDDARFYVLDFGGRTLGFASEMPHCLGVAFRDDEDKVGNIFDIIMQELDFRKNKFAENDVGNIHEYKKVARDRIPAILLVLDNCSVFRERYEEQLQDTLVSIAREGANYGIYLVITGSDTNAVYYKIKDYVKQFLTLQMTDKSSYMEILGQTNGLEPENFKGRGVVKLDVPLEFQTALALEELDEAERTKKLKQIFKEMKSVWTALGKGTYKIAGRTFPPVREISAAKAEAAATASMEPKQRQVYGLDTDSMDINSYYNALTSEMLPLAWNCKTGLIESMDLETWSGFFIGGFEKTGKTNTVRQLVKTIKRQNGFRAYVFEAGSDSMKGYCSSVGADGYMNSGEEFDAFIEGLIKEVNKRITARGDYRKSKGNPQGEYTYMSQYEKVFILIDGFVGFFDSISNKSAERINKIFSIGLQNLNIYFITSERIDMLEKPYTDQAIFIRLIKTGFGIFLGGMVNQQSIISFDEMEASERTKILQAGQGYMYRDGKHVWAKVPLAE